MYKFFQTDIQEIRLANGTDNIRGRVEIRMNNTWGVICGQSLDRWAGLSYDLSSNEANALCKMLGFE